MADYLANPTPMGQIGILRQAKNPGANKPLIIQYQLARKCIAACIQAPTSTTRLTVAAIAHLEQRRDDPSNSPLVRDDAARCIEVINAYVNGSNLLDIGGVRFEAPPNSNASLMIEGVEITMWPDAIAKTSVKSGGDRVGAVFIRCAIGSAGETAENRRAEARGHLATIAHMHALEALGHLGTPHPSSSMVIDVPRSVVVRAPVNIARRVANIHAACQMIAAYWPQA